MKVRTVVVWFRKPVDMLGGAGGPNFPRKTKLEFEVQVSGGPAADAAERLLRSAPHPEDRAEGPAAEMMADVVSAISQLQARMQEAPTPGARLLPGWVEFTTAAGEILLVPQEQIAWIELGAETERA